MFKNFAIMSAGLFFLSVATVSAQNIPTPSTWVNQRASVLTIESIDSKGKLKGNFVNNASNTDCQGKPGFDVAGKQKPDGSIVFAVVFGTCNTVTVWIGKLKGNTIDTTFREAYPDDNGKMHVVRGKDTFTKQ